MTQHHKAVGLAIWAGLLFATVAVCEAGEVRPRYPVPRDRVIVLDIYSRFVVNVDKDTGRMIVGRTHEADAMANADFVYRQIGKKASVVVRGQPFSNEYTDACQLLSSNGEFIQTPAFSGFVGSVDDGVLWIHRTPVNTRDWEWALIRIDGTTVSPFSTSSRARSAFASERCSLVDDKDPRVFQVIDQAAKTIIKGDEGYDMITQYHQGRCLASKGNTTYLLDIHGKQVKRIEDRVVYDLEQTCGLTPARDVKTNKIGVVNQDLQWVLQPRWGNVTVKSETLFAVTTQTDNLDDGWRWSVVDARGKPLSTETFSKIRPLSNHRCAIYKNGGWGYMDGGGKLVIPPTFVDVSDYVGGFALVGRAEPGPNKPGETRVRLEVIDLNGKTMDRTSLTYWGP